MATALPELLCHVNFPLYQSCMVSPRHILFGGGGGAAKTGVHNGFEIFEIGHNGEHCVAEPVTRYETGGYAIMNISASAFDVSKQRTVIAVGHNEKTQLYTLELAQECLPKDKANKTNNNFDSTRLVFKVSPGKNVQTDFNIPEPYQKVVKISLDGKLMATGGDDGLLRIWTFPELSRVHEIDAHEKEIDDLEFSPDQTKLLSISKDSHAYVWDVKKGKKHAGLGWDPPSHNGNKVKYLFKRIRCARVEGDARKYKVFTIVNPVAASKPPSYLQRWDPKTFAVQQMVSVDGSLSALAVSDNGHFVATGSMFDGTVEIYTAFNLAKLKRVEKSHSTFITGLEFLPTSAETDSLRGYSEASVVSISVDHQVCIHHIPRLHTVSMMFAGTIITLVLLATFILCSYLGI